MDLREGQKHIAEHYAEADRRVLLLHRAVLVQMRREFHRRAAVAWKARDVIEHRVNCIAANEVAGQLQQLPRS